MKLWILGSGSSGNSVLIETERSRILVDAGFSPRVLKQRLARAGVAPDSIEAVVVTHEHTDHVKGVGAAARKWGWTIVSTAGTRMMCPEWSELRTILTPRKSSVVVGDFHLETVPVPHDANEPIAVIVTSIGEGARAGIVYDLGQVTDSISRALDKLDVLVINAAYLPSLTPVTQMEPKQFGQALTVNVLATQALLAAFEVLLDCYAAEVEKLGGTRVAIVDPGATRTAMRAKAYPGEDPDTLPHPSTAAPALIDMISPNYSGNGQRVDFLSKETRPL